MKTSAWFSAPTSSPLGPCVAGGAFGLASALVLLAVVPQTGRAQTRVTLSGTVKDAATGEDLSGVTVRLRELPAVGAAANAYGFYTLTVPAGTYTVEASFVGYQARAQPLTLSGSQRLDFRLAGSGRELTEVVVTGHGSAVTYPVGRYEVDGQAVALYGARNPDRPPAYTRLDVGGARRRTTSLFKRTRANNCL